MQRFYMVIMVREGAILGVQAAMSGGRDEEQAIDALIHDETRLCEVFFESGAYPEPPRDGLWFTLGEFEPCGTFGMRVVPRADRDADGMRRDFSEAPWARLSTAHLIALADGTIEPGCAAWVEGKV